ncbi:TPA: hypothetical protein ACF2DE_002958 [Clostridium perfringens]
MKKSELNSNIHLSEGNIKSQETEDILFLTWSLPSRKTCPYATDECKKRCFAKKNETFKNVRESRERNLNETKKDTFVKDMINHLEYHLSRPKAKNKNIFVRIHTSGDFYCYDYFKKWVEISSYFKDNAKILFQAYTKSVIYIDDYIKSKFDYLPSRMEVEKILNSINIHIVYSIWHDTSKKDVSIAMKLGLQTFTALPKDKIPIAVEKGDFLCNGNCGNCKECYTGKSLKIVIPYH